MELLKTEISNVQEGINRLTGTVRYDNGSEDEYWFEYPSNIEISDSGNPWLAALLPMAATIGEDLIINLPVDPRLVDGAGDILRFWHAFEEMKTSIISIVPNGGLEVAQEYPGESASFFSSGVDAFYTAYKQPKAKYKILIHGFDLDIKKEAEFEYHCARISKLVDQMDNIIIPIKANIRHTRWKETRWQALSHGAALAGIGLLFEKQFSEIFVPSSSGVLSDLGIWGSHPLTDPLFSTSRTSIITSGDGVSRFEKVKYISQFKLVTDNLHVCVRGKDGSGQDEVNCSHCEKCYRTMIALDLSGVLDQSKLFDKSRYNYDEVYKVYFNAKDTIREFTLMAEDAQKQGKTELADGIYKAIRRSKFIDRIGFLDNMPILWRVINKMMNNSIY